MRVALTFDAEHPDRPRCAPGGADIADTLTRLGVRATFFMQGRWVQAYPDLARRLAADGHLIGSHSFYHARMPLLSDEGMRSDLLDAQTVIQETVGADPRPWFRCPWGAGWDDPRVLRTLSEAGYRHAGWDVVAEDWEPDRTPEAIEDAVVRGVVDPASNGTVEKVVLLHTWPEQTASALPAVIERLRAEGAEFVALDAFRSVTHAIVD